MNKLRAIVIIGITVAGVCGASVNAEAAPQKFRNCASLNKVYPGGVGKPAAKDKTPTGTRVGSHTKNMKVYNTNRHLDRDKDGIACERYPSVRRYSRPVLFTGIKPIIRNVCVETNGTTVVTYDLKKFTRGRMSSEFVEDKGDTQVAQTKVAGKWISLYTMSGGEGHLRVNDNRLSSLIRVVYDDGKNTVYSDPAVVTQKECTAG